MAASIEAGHIVSPPASPTLSDGTAGGIDDDTITFDLCRTLVDEWIDVTEAEIAASVTGMIDDHHQLIEGAAGVALAATGRLASRDPGSSIVAVSCGANISTSTLRHILTAHLA
jgi:threonine dehydratase